MLGVTVGVDGSHNSQQALEWAMKEAALRHATLTVLTVHEVAASHWTSSPIIMPSVDQPAEETARQAAEDLVAKVISQLDGAPAPRIAVRVVSGFPARELIEASRNSDLLVVGSRGGGGFTRLMLGSVSSQIVHHTACPVVVVPADR